LAAEPGTHAEKRSEKQSITGAPIHLIGTPKVVVQNRGTDTLVTVTDAPWGWGDLDRCFLHQPLKTKSISAERYALQLQQRIATAAWAEHGRRERLKEARRQEREAVR
jgi:hypothetical protein